MEFYQILLVMALIMTAAAQFNCPSTQAQGVKKAELVIPSSPISASGAQLSVSCKGFALPNDTSYHVVATSSLINSTSGLMPMNMLLFACPTPVGGFENSAFCSLDSIKYANCTDLIGVWATGFPGQCLPDSYGFLIGQRYPYAILQVTWFISSSPPSTTLASSGLALYYTSTLRPNSGAMLMIRQVNFTVPAMQPSYDVQATCSPTCTSQLTTTPISLTGAGVYMHQLGASANLIVQRNGKQQAVVVNSTYNPTNPMIMNLDKVVEVQPGDALQLTCNYNSRNQSNPTDVGFLPSQETCMAFVSYYPASDKFSDCYQWKSLDFCNEYAFKAQCPIDAFTYLSGMLSMPTVCQLPTCSVLCRSVAQATINTNCLYGDMGSYLHYAYPTVNLIDPLLEWCGISLNTAPTTSARPSTVTLKGNAPTTDRWQFTSLLLMASAALLPYVIKQ